MQHSFSMGSHASVMSTMSSSNLSDAKNKSIGWMNEGSEGGDSQKSLSARAKVILKEHAFVIVYEFLKEPSASFTTAVLTIFVEFVQFIGFLAYPDAAWSWESVFGVGVQGLTGISHAIGWMGRISVGSIFAVQTTVFIMISLLMYTSYILRKSSQFLSNSLVRITRTFWMAAISWLFIPIMSILMITLDCEGNVGSPHVYIKVDCWTGIHPLLAAVSVLVLLMFIPVCVFLSSTMHQIDITRSQDALGAAHGRLDSLRLFGKMLLVILFTLGRHNINWRWHLLFSATVVFGAILYGTLLFVPYYVVAVNMLRSGFSAALLWSSLCAMIGIRSGESSAVILMLVSSPLAFLFGVMAVRRRMEYLRCLASVEQPKNPFDVEVKARLAIIHAASMTSSAYEYSALDYHNDSSNVWDGVHEIFKMGIKRFPASPLLLVHMALFQIYVMRNKTAADKSLSEAALVAPELDVQYFIYHARRAEVDDDMDSKERDDIIKYVEFQTHSRDAMMDDIVATRWHRKFWGELMRSVPNMDGLLVAGQSIESHVSSAHRHFAALLRLNPSSVLALEKYAHFVRDLRFEHARSRKLMQRAKALKQSGWGKMKQLDAGFEFLKVQRENLDIFDEGNAVLTMAVDEKQLGDIVDANAVACRYFGYPRSKLVGMNMRDVMPEPLSTAHDAFLQKYLETGVAIVLNKTRLVIGLSKDGYVFPVLLFVRKGNKAQAESAGANRVLLGVIQCPQFPQTELYVQWDANCIVQFISENFSRHFGVTAEEINEGDVPASRFIPEIMKAGIREAITDRRGCRLSKCHVWGSHVTSYGLNFSVVRIIILEEEELEGDDDDDYDEDEEEDVVVFDESQRIISSSSPSISGSSDTSTSVSDSDNKRDDSECGGNTANADSPRDTPQSRERKNCSRDPASGLELARRLSANRRRRQSVLDVNTGDLMMDITAKNPHVRKFSKPTIAKHVLRRFGNPSPEPDSPDDAVLRGLSSSGPRRLRVQTSSSFLGANDDDDASSSEEKQAPKRNMSENKRLDDAASAYSGGSSVMSKRAVLEVQFMKLKHKLRAENRKTNINMWRKKFSLFLLILVLFGLMLANVLSVTIKFNQTVNKALGIIRNAGERASLCQWIATDVQTLDLIRQASLPGSGSATAASIKNELNSLVDRFEVINTALYIHEPIIRSFSPLLGMLTQPSVLVTERMPLGSPEGIFVRSLATLFEVNVDIISRVRQMLTMDLSKIDTSSNRDVYYVVYNGMNSILEANADFANLSKSLSLRQAAKTYAIITAILVFVVVICCVSVFLVFVPTLLRVESAKEHILRMFLQIPHSLIASIRSRFGKRLLEIGDDKEQEDPSGSEGDFGGVVVNLKTLGDDDGDDGDEEVDDDDKKDAQGLSGAQGVAAAMQGGLVRRKVPGSGLPSFTSVSVAAPVPRFRRLYRKPILKSLKFTVLFWLVCAYFVASFVLLVGLEDRTASSEKSLNASSERQIVMQEVFSHVQLLASLHTLGKRHTTDFNDTYALTMQKVDMATKLEHALLFGGDISMGFVRGDQDMASIHGIINSYTMMDNLMFSDACVVGRIKTTVAECDAFSAGLIKHGLHQSLNEVLRRSKAAALKMDSSSAYNVSSDMMWLRDAMRLYVRPVLGYATKLHTDFASKTLADGVSQQKVLVTLCMLGVLVSMWATLLPVTSAIQREMRDARAILLVIPPEVVETVPVVRQYIRSTIDT